MKYAAFCGEYCCWEIGSGNYLFMDLNSSNIFLLSTFSYIKFTRQQIMEYIYGVDFVVDKIIYCDLGTVRKHSYVHAPYFIQINLPLPLHI